MAKTVEYVTLPIPASGIKHFGNYFGRAGRIVSYFFGEFVQIFPRVPIQSSATGYRIGPNGEYNAFGQGIAPGGRYTSDPVTRMRNGQIPGGFGGGKA